MTRSESVGGPLGGHPTRLPPSAMGVWIVKSLIGLIPAALVFFVGSMPVGAILLFVLVFQVTHVVTWLRFTWRLDASSLIIERGLLRRQRRVIPRDRVQSVDLERTLIHRLLGVTEVRVEAIGAGDTEGQLPALEPAVAERLRSELLRTSGVAGGDSRSGKVAPTGGDGVHETWPTGERDPDGSIPGAFAEPPDEVLVRVSPRDLLVAGITGGRVGVGAAILGLVSQVAPADWVARFLLPGLEQFPDPLTLAGLRLILFLFGMAFLVGFLASLIATILVHWRFTLIRTSTALEVTRGLLTEHRDTVPFRRIQAVRVEENWIRRLLGLASVKVVVAGRAGSAQGGGADLVLPIGSREEAFQLAARVVGCSNGGAPDLNAMPDPARRRRQFRAWVVGAGAAAAGGIAGHFVDPWSPWIASLTFGLLMLAPGLVLAHLAYRGLGWAERGSHVMVREGALTRRSFLLPIASVQEFRTVSNPFQRRRGLATLELHIARPVALSLTPRALDLAGPAAEELRERWARLLSVRS